MAIQVNQEHHDLTIEIFRTLDDIFENYVAFDKMSVVLETRYPRESKLPRIVMMFWDGKDI